MNSISFQSSYDRFGISYDRCAVSYGRFLRRFGVAVSLAFGHGVVGTFVVVGVIDVVGGIGAMLQVVQDFMTGP